MNWKNILLIILILSIGSFLTWWLLPKINSSEWKTHEDNIYGLELKYPSDWNLWDRNEGYMFTMFSPWTEKQIDSRDGSYFPALEIRKLKTFEDIEEDAFVYQKEVIEQLYSNMRDSEISYFIEEGEIDGSPAVLVRINDNLAETTEYWVVRDFERYLISYFFPINQPEYKSTFQEMIDSFRFLEQ